MHLQEHFVDARSTVMLARIRLPARVSLLCIPAMPPVYLNVFGRLTEYIALHLFLLHPCREYWGDIVALRRMGSRPRRHLSGLHIGAGFGHTIGYGRRHMA